VKRANPPFENCWALPGGFVAIDEDLEACALRELKEETGVSGVFLEQLYTFGAPKRDPRERVITVAYYALVPAEGISIRAASDAREAAWHPCDNLPLLAFDHDTIIAMALNRLRAKLEYSTIAFQFLPGKFTLSELQRVYEIILGEALDKRNFRRRIQTYGLLQETGEKTRNGNHRPAALYSARTRGTVEFIK
jgi:8-oxo-dGTP diphosphatase